MRTRLVATAKAPPHGVKVRLEEDILDGVKLESVAATRGRVFVVDSYLLGSSRWLSASISHARARSFFSIAATPCWNSDSAIAVSSARGGRAGEQRQRSESCADRARVGEHADWAVSGFDSKRSISRPRAG